MGWKMSSSGSRKTSKHFYLSDDSFGYGNDNDGTPMLMSL